LEQNAVFACEREKGTERFQGKSAGESEQTSVEVQRQIGMREKGPLKVKSTQREEKNEVSSKLTKRD